MLAIGGECKSWTLDSGLDHGLDYGLEYGLEYGLNFTHLQARAWTIDIVDYVVYYNIYAWTRSNVWARNSTGEPTAAAGRSPRQLSITTISITTVTGC